MFPKYTMHGSNPSALIIKMSVVKKVPISADTFTKLLWLPWMFLLKCFIFITLTKTLFKLITILKRINIRLIVGNNETVTMMMDTNFFKLVCVKEKVELLWLLGCRCCYCCRAKTLMQPFTQSFKGIDIKLGILAHHDKM